MPGGIAVRIDRDRDQRHVRGREQQRERHPSPMVEPVGGIGHRVQPCPREQVEHAGREQRRSGRLVAQIEEPPVEIAEVVPGPEALGGTHQRTGAFVMRRHDHDRFGAVQAGPEPLKEAAGLVVCQSKRRRAMRQEESGLCHAPDIGAFAASRKRLDPQSGVAGVATPVRPERAAFHRAPARTAPK